MRISRARLACHHTYLSALEQTPASLRKFLLDVVIYSKVFCF